MNDIAELKQYVVAHAETQGLAADGYGPVLDRIVTDADGGPGSWVHEWSAAAAEREVAGDLLAACLRYNFARFPFVSGQARGDALRRCVEVFDRWRVAEGGVERLDVAVDGGVVRCWAAGLAPSRPLLLVTGGIVSVKEQWGQVLVQAAGLGLGVVVTELPGVGENPLRYGADSWRLLPAVLDAVRHRVDVDRTYALAVSFSGHLALRAAGRDRRLRGLVLAGAPVREFFTDRAWQAGLPRLTVDTLAHLTGEAPADLADHLAGWGLTDAELAAVDVPVHALIAARDEIVPPGDARLLRDGLRDVTAVTLDDVHGSPHHGEEVRLWTVLSLMRLAGVGGPPRAAIEERLAALRAAREPARQESA